MPKRKGTALVWLRNDLRVQDHSGFFKATQTHQRVVAYYSFDPRHYEQTKWGFKKTEYFRTQFLRETLLQLQHQLLQYNITLILSAECPEKNIPQRVNDLGIEHIYFQNEWTQEERIVEQKLRAACGESVEFIGSYDQFLYHPGDAPMAIEQLPEVFTVFRKKCEKYSRIRNVYPDPTAMPPSNLLDEKFIVPQPSELGLHPVEKHPHSAFPFIGGSQSANERLEHYFWTSEKISYYKQTRNGLLGLDYSSKFSPWLANGSISARQIYWEVKAYEQQVENNQSTYWLIFELIWRDYFKYVALKHRDKIFQLGGILNRTYDWKVNPKLLNDWISGNTKEPFVNANMIELRKTGWMSNRGRQNVASYFAKNLLMDWRIGAAYFESFLLDYDVHSNYGNWMYVAGVGNDPRDRKFNVRMQAERYDENGKFQRLWNQKSLFE